MKTNKFRADSGYTFSDCIKVFQEFYKRHNRIPTTKEICELSKKKLSPSMKVFGHFGGINWVAEKAGLPINRKSRSAYESGEVFLEFTRFVIEFKKDHGRLPTIAECREAAKKAGYRVVKP